MGAREFWELAAFASQPFLTSFQLRAKGEGVLSTYRTGVGTVIVRGDTDSHQEARWRSKLARHTTYNMF